MKSLVVSREYHTEMVALMRNALGDDEESIHRAKTLVDLITAREDSIEAFINLEDAGRLLNATKGNLKLQLHQNDFDEGSDFVSYDVDTAISERKRGRPKRHMRITLPTFRRLAESARSHVGRSIKLFYEEAEIAYRLLRKQNPLGGNQTAIHLALQSAAREAATLEHFPPNTQCVYWGTVDNCSENGEKLVKFGNSNDLNQRVADHRRTYDNFRLVSAFRVCNKLLIENFVKKDPQLRPRRRSIKAKDGRMLTELIAITMNTGVTVFTPTQLDEIFREIIEEHEYSVANYANVLAENEKLRNDIVTLNEELRLWNEHKKKKREDAVITSITNRNSVTFCHVAPKAGLLLYAFKCSADGQQYTCNICRPSDLEQRTRLLKGAYPDGEMAHTVSVCTDFAVVPMNWLVGARLAKVSQKVHEGDFTTIKDIFALVAAFEKLVVGNTCLKTALRQLTCDVAAIHSNNNDQVREDEPETPVLRKARRQVRQVHAETGVTVNTFESLEAAGKAIGVTGTAIGIALRNRRLSAGFRWLYADFTAEEQSLDQPVIKINCKTGEKMKFPSMCAAGADAGVSSVALRQRILTDVHVKSFHWVFDKGATHYTS